MNKYIQVPFSDDEAERLRAGDFVYISGTIYTARDAAHKRMAETLDRGEEIGRASCRERVSNCG